MGALIGKGKEGNKENGNSLSPVRRELQIDTGRIPPLVPHPVLLFTCGGKKTYAKTNPQTEKLHNMHYWKRSKTARDHSGGAGSFLLPHHQGEKYVDSHQNHQLPAHRKETSLLNIRLILASQSLCKVMLCRNEKRKVTKGYQ